MTPHRRATDVEHEREALRRRTEVALPLRIRPLWSVQFTVQFVVFGALLLLIGPNGLPDVGRVAFLAASAFYLLMAVVVVRVYWEVSRVIQGKARMLPQHVRWVVVGDVLVTCGLAGYITILIGSPVVGYGIPLVLATTGMILKSVALGVMWRFQLVRIHGERLRQAEL